MNDELSLRLKNAGFPQPDMTGRAVSRIDSNGIAHEIGYKPSLSELIEACGKGFKGLLKGSFLAWDYDRMKYEDFDGYFAGQLDGDNGSCLEVTYEPHGFGSSAEEAVAMLWLALNDK